MADAAFKYVAVGSDTTQVVMDAFAGGPSGKTDLTNLYGNCATVTEGGVTCNPNTATTGQQQIDVPSGTFVSKEGTSRHMADSGRPRCDCWGAWGGGGLAVYSLACSNYLMNVQRPRWWTYPIRCANGHPWGPGRVRVSWRPCQCAPARATQPRGSGHRMIACGVPGCRSVFFEPPHDPATALTPTGHHASLSLSGDASASGVLAAWGRGDSGRSATRPG